MHVKPDAERPLYGANNVADLILSRVGNYNFKWDGQKLFWKWNKFHMKHSKVKNIICSYPVVADIPADRSPVNYKLSKNDAQLIFGKNGIVLQPGLGVCKAHQNMVKALIGNEKESESDPPYCPHTSEHMDYDKDNDFDDGERNDCVEVYKTIPKDLTSYSLVKKFADSFNIKKLVTKKPYESLKRRTTMKKRTSAKFLFSKIAEAAAPNNEERFLESVCGKFEKPSAKKWKNKLLENVAAQIEKAVDDKMLKLNALSTVTYIVSYGEVLNYLPNLTYYYYHEAKKTLN